MSIDLSIVRDFRFNERMRLQFRSEAFNLFNHPNLDKPNSRIGDAAVGIISSAVNNERQIQLALKFYF